MEQTKYRIKKKVYEEALVLQNYIMIGKIIPPCGYVQHNEYLRDASLKLGYNGIPIEKCINDKVVKEIILDFIYVEKHYETALGENKETINPCYYPCSDTIEDLKKNIEMPINPNYNYLTVKCKSQTKE